VLEALRPDAIHLHGLWEPMLHTCARWARRQRIPYGLTPHGMEGPWHRGNRRGRKAVLGRICGYARTWNGAAWIQALNEEEQVYWSKRTSGTVLRIPNGVTVSPPAGAPPPWLQAVAADQTVIVFLGRLHPQKDPFTALEAFLQVADACPQALLVLAGPDGGLQRDLEARLRGHAAASRVWLPGWVGPEDKAHLWSRADLCLHPSRSEGHSLTLLEAAAHGVPVLMRPEAEFPELAACGGARVFQGGAEACARELRALLDDPGQRAAMGNAGRDEVLRTYSWDRTVEALLEALG
jgi:glycosyltransferase involved in cell wall biosynthesis